MGSRPLFILHLEAMNKLSIAERVREITLPVVAGNGLELVHVEVVGSERQPVVRIFIDKQGGVTHEDCSLVSRQVGEVLDDKDFISSAYLLEVSSPGLERGLYSLRDFERFAGRLAKVKTNIAVCGQRNFRGRITSIEGEEIVFEDKTNGLVRFPHSAVVKANLEIDFEEELKRNG